MWLGPDLLVKANILKLLTILHSFKIFVTHG